MVESELQSLHGWKAPEDGQPEQKTTIYFRFCEKKKKKSFTVVCQSDNLYIKLYKRVFAPFESTRGLVCWLTASLEQSSSCCHTRNWPFLALAPMQAALQLVFTAVAVQTPSWSLTWNRHNAKWEKLQITSLILSSLLYFPRYVTFSRSQPKTHSRLLIMFPFNMLPFCNVPACYVAF